jgi:hypothetical protein
MLLSSFGSDALVITPGWVIPELRLVALLLLVGMGLVWRATMARRAGRGVVSG